MESVKKYWTIFVSILAGVFGLLFFFYKRKADTSEVLENNLESERNILTKEREIAIVEGKLEAEEEKRKFLQEQIAKESEKNDSLENLNDYFNNTKPK